MSGTKTCPYCGEEILLAAKKCKHCHEWVEESVSPTPQTKVCPTCGESIPAESKICPLCNEPIKQPSPTIPQNKIKSSSKPKLTYIVLAILAICVLIILAVTIPSKKGTVISESPIDDGTEYVAETDPIEISGPTEDEFADRWESGFFQDSFGEDDPNLPFIRNEFSTDAEPLTITIGPGGFMLSSEYFPSPVDEITIKDEQGNQTTMPCVDTSTYHSTITQDRVGYQTLINLLDNGSDFTLRLKCWTYGNEYYYKAYKVNGWSGQGVKRAIQKHLVK